jgi:alginate O-acetyltransferase complex protein AlgI
LLFNSFEFFIFLVITYTLYRLLPWQKQNGLLLVASYIFYAWWDVRFLLLIAIATVINYSCALQIHNAPIDSGKHRDRPLWISIGSNLAILGFFKYFNFFADTLTQALSGLGIPAAALHLNIALPIGISFYTFRAMSYTIDVWRGKLAAETHFSYFALFLAFFPSLLAGPIDRAGDLLPQIAQRRSLSLEQTTRGLFLILFGLFKKVAIANGVAGSVTAIYQGTGIVSWLDVIAATLLYTLQIYCDFSGYSDMARGIAKLFGFELRVNFNLPYFSKEPSEFWRRWHISLSTWLRDYLYISLGGNRKGNIYVNLMTTMVLGGLWHGANWNFLLWGFYQGALLCGYRVVAAAKPTKPTAVQTQVLENEKGRYTGSPLLRENDPKFWISPPSIGGLGGRMQGVQKESDLCVDGSPTKGRLRVVQGLSSLAAIALFFALTSYGWLLFGVTSFERIATLTRILLTDIGHLSLSMPMPPLAALLGIPLLIAYEILEYRLGKPQFYLRLPTPARGALYGAFIFIVLMGGSNAPAQFIYSKF